MLYESLVSENRAAFVAKVIEISKKLGINPEWLMIVMQMESQINHRAINRTTNATGLIQFMPSTALGLGTSTTALYSMSNVQQLDFVYKYFKPYSGRLNSVTDLYAVTFFPRALGKPDSYILETDTLHADTIARQNPVFDINKDKKITYGEFKAAILSRIPSEAVAYLKKK
jgi:hypothetical protein